MPGDDDPVVLGNPVTLKILGIDVYDSLGARAREQANIAGVVPRHTSSVVALR